MPTFCRHNRFLERCPICSKTLPDAAPPSRTRSAPKRSPARSGTRASGSSQGAAGGVRIRRQERAAEDGYRSELLPGLRASTDAARLADEIAFSGGRLLALATRPPGLYGEAKALAADDLEQATRTCFLIAYLGPLEGSEPFAGIRAALASERAGVELELDELPLGPRTSHERARHGATIEAYRKWVAQAGSQRAAFTGDPGWTPERRFERIFERLALPGFARGARYELLVLLGALELFELRAGSLLFSGARVGSSEDPATLAAKRVFGIADPALLDRRAASVAEAVSVPIAALELALANWGAGARATLGFPPESSDEQLRERAYAAFAL